MRINNYTLSLKTHEETKSRIINSATTVKLEAEDMEQYLLGEIDAYGLPYSTISPEALRNFGKSLSGDNLQLLREMEAAGRL